MTGRFSKPSASTLCYSHRSGRRTPSDQFLRARQLFRCAALLAQIALRPGIGHAVVPSPRSGAIAPCPTRAFTGYARLHLVAIRTQQSRSADRGLARFLAGANGTVATNEGRALAVIDSTFAAAARRIRLRRLNRHNRCQQKARDRDLRRAQPECSKASKAIRSRYHCRSPAPRSRSWRASRRSADKGHGQALTNQDLANVATVDLKLAASPAVVAFFRSLGSGLARARY